MATSILKAGIADVDAVAPLLDAYRQYYGRASDAVLAKRFVADRLSRNESVVLLAKSGDAVTGFVQLFPSFSSVRATRIYVLNDLFVIPEARGKGTGRLLMEAAMRTAREGGAARLKLSTTVDNIPAQKLYESLGWVRDRGFYDYNFALQPQHGASLPSDRITNLNSAVELADTTTYQNAAVNGVNVFYRQAGPKDAPTVILLHGYPSSSRMYDPLLLRLADRYHLIAPDYPGFGHSEAPPPARYRYTFDDLAQTMGALVDQLDVHRYVLFMQDYGGPVGMRMALRSPERIQALIVQNANAYEEGLGSKWTGIAEYWADPAAHPEQVDAFTSLEGARQRHLGGSPHPERYNPDTWADEFALLSRPGQREIQAALLYDYRTNVAAYPAWQAWLRLHAPPTLVLWGRYDPSFIVPGALAYARDVPNAEIRILDAGHFALDEKPDEVAQLTRSFLARYNVRSD